MLRRLGEERAGVDGSLTSQHEFLFAGSLRSLDPEAFLEKRIYVTVEKEQFLLQQEHDLTFETLTSTPAPSDRCQRKRDNFPLDRILVQFFPPPLVHNGRRSLASKAEDHQHDIWREFKMVEGVKG